MLIKTGLLGPLSGKMNGIVASHNRGGRYLRTLVIPTNPNTPAQQEVRSIMANLAAAWGEVLTQANRDAWEAYAANVPLTNRLGDAIHVSGQNMFIRCNSARVNAGEARVDQGPATFNMGEMGVVSITASVSTQLISVTFDDTLPWADEGGNIMIIQQAREVSPTINYFGGPFLWADNIDGDPIAPPSTPETIAVNSAITLGNRLFCRARISRADGRLSAVQIVNCVIAA